MRKLFMSLLFAFFVAKLSFAQEHSDPYQVTLQCIREADEIGNPSSVSSQNILQVNVSLLPAESRVLFAQDSGKFTTESPDNPDIVVHYGFEGNSNDDSGHEQHGSISPGISFGTGVCKQAAWFEDQSEARISVAHDTILDVPQQFAISLWVYPTAYRAVTANSHILVSQWFTSPTRGNYTLRLGAGEQAGLLVLTVANTDNNTFNTAYVVAPDDQRVSLNNWSHIAAVFDNGLVRLYINGIQVIEQITAISHTETSLYEHNDLIIGNLWTNQWYEYGFTGGMDELYLFNRVLTSQEIEDLAFTPTPLATSEEHRFSSCGINTQFSALDPTIE